MMDSKMPKMIQKDELHYDCLKCREKEQELAELKGKYECSDNRTISRHRYVELVEKERQHNELLGLVGEMVLDAETNLLPIREHISFGKVQAFIKKAKEA
jgi:hypothetical protein